jgi:aspartyl protease family protein
MPQPEGPWGRKARQGLTSQQQLLIGVAVALAGALLIWKLAEAFPDALQSDWDKFRLINLIGFIALLSASIVLGRRFRTRDAIRNIAIWCAVFAALGLGYTFSGELGWLGDRVRGELFPGTPVSSGPHEMAVNASEGGSYYVDGTINGAPAHFAIDTGASGIVLSPDDAARAGIDVAHLDYSLPVETAHGASFNATARVDRLVVGNFELHDVEVEINKLPMGSSLLGMTFLKRLDSFGVEKGRFVMRWH